jgi:hypothetical protein
MHKVEFVMSKVEFEMNKVEFVMSKVEFEMNKVEFVITCKWHVRSGT